MIVSMNRIAVLLAAALLTACATPYAPTGITGGFSERELEPNIWRVHFAGNGFTKPETVQTYWLYRCAELTVEKGFEGFEVLSGIQLAEARPFSPIQVAAGGGVIYLPMYYDTRPHPSLEGDIRLLRWPFVPEPKKRFDAAALKAMLEPHVKGEKCDEGNVCPHVHHYLLKPVESSPEGRP